MADMHGADFTFGINDFWSVQRMHNHRADAGD